MRRRAFLGALGTAGVTGTGVFAVTRSRTALLDPTVVSDGVGRRAMLFTVDGEEVGHLGVDGSRDGEVIDLDTEIWHREGTAVESVRLRVWLPETENDGGTDVAVVSPVQGDSSPPPTVSLSTTRGKRGAVVELDDLDDLRDETISTLELLVSPGSETATTVAIDATIELASERVLSGGYTLEGRLDVDVPVEN